MRHVIMEGTTVEPNRWDGSHESVQFFQDTDTGTLVHFDGDGTAQHGHGYKNLESARAAFRRFNPPSCGYKFKWKKVNEPMTKYDIMRDKRKALEKHKAESE